MTNNNKTNKNALEKMREEMAKNGITFSHQRTAKQAWTDGIAEMKMEIKSTLSDIKLFTDKNPSFSFFLYCLFISLLILIIFK